MLTSTLRRTLAVTGVTALTGIGLAVSTPGGRGQAASRSPPRSSTGTPRPGRAAVIACISPYHGRPARGADVRHGFPGRPRRAQRHRPQLGVVRRQPFRAPARASVDAAVAAAAHDALDPGLRAVTGPFVPCLRRRQSPRSRSFYAAKVAAIPDGRPRPPASRPATGRRRDRRTCGLMTGRTDPARRLRLPRGHHPRRLPVHPRVTASPSHPNWGNVTPVRAPQRHPVPVGAPAGSDQRAGTRAISTRSRPSAATASPHRSVVRRGRPRSPHFWWESSPLMWDAIARTLSARPKHLDPWEQARTLRPAQHGPRRRLRRRSWPRSTTTLYWRPVTAIRAGRRRTATRRRRPIPTWTPLRRSPRAIPDHPSGHSIEGGGGSRRLHGVLRHRPHARSPPAARPWRPATGRADSAHPILHHFTVVHRGGRGERRLPGLDRLPLPVRDAGGHRRRADDGPLDRLRTGCGRRAEDAPTVMDPSARDVCPGRSVMGRSDRVRLVGPVGPLLEVRHPAVARRTGAPTGRGTPG